MSGKAARNLRRVSQILFFILFVWLILKTNFDVSFDSASVSDIRLPYPVSLFLEFDPLAALGTLLATGTLYKGLLWSLVILIPTIFIGRFFCGWICPMGTLNHWVSEIPSERLGRKGRSKIESNRYRRYQRIKYYILLFFVAAAIMGTMQIGLLDPLSLLARSIGTVVFPIIHAIILGIVGWISGLGWPPLGEAAQAGYDAIAPWFLNFRPVHFQGVLLIGSIFVLVLVLNRLFTRFWCRGICPLGAMLGLFSRFAIFGLEKKEATCTHCNLCLLHCQGADNPDIGSKWRQAECHMCLNCTAACPEGSLSFKFFPNMAPTQHSPAPTRKVDISRRKVILSLAAGAAFVPLIRIGAGHQANPQAAVIRPPGSVGEDHFLDTCIRCGQCMRVCPNNALHPTIAEAGFEGLWTPVLKARIGYCEPTCTLCTQVCPTGAIRELTIEEKTGADDLPPVRIGTAFIDRGRCLPWAMERSCIVCEEWCPVSPKAIFTREETIINRAGQPVTLRRPYVDPEACTGCGACEFACPVVDDAAVYITSVGESRSPENQILLERHRRKA